MYLYIIHQQVWGCAFDGPVELKLFMLPKSAVLFKNAVARTLPT